MANDQKNTRVQFGKDATAKQVYDVMRDEQDKWALAHPDLAHKKYPTVYDEQGKRIKK